MQEPEEIITSTRPRTLIISVAALNSACDPKRQGHKAAHSKNNEECYFISCANIARTTAKVVYRIIVSVKHVERTARETAVQHNTDQSNLSQ